MKRPQEEEAWLKQRLQQAVDDVAGGSADKLGRMIGYANGGPIRQSLSVRPVQQAVIERTEKLPNMSGWFDNPSKPAIAANEGPGSGISAKPGHSARFTLLPVVPFKGVDMSTKSDQVGATDWLTAPGQYSPRAQYTQMPDDSMVPEIFPGEYVCFDPEVAPDTGDTVLLSDQHGGLWVRRYRQLPAGKFDAVPLNDTHAPMRSDTDGLVVKAVMVGHWRGRRSKRH